VEDDVERELEGDVGVPQAVKIIRSKAWGIKKCFIMFIIWKRGMHALNMLI
jgi:hypothetical protein